MPANVDHGNTRKLTGGGSKANALSKRQPEDHTTAAPCGTQFIKHSGRKEQDSCTRLAKSPVLGHTSAPSVAQGFILMMHPPRCRHARSATTPRSPRWREDGPRSVLVGASRFPREPCTRTWKSRVQRLRGRAMEVAEAIYAVLTR